MTTRITLISCVKQKCDSAVAARDLYLSQLFRKQRRYAETYADTWYILSAEYGVLHPEEVVKPYELTLNAMPKKERNSWAQRVRLQLADLLPSGAEITILAGKRYREGIEPFLIERGFSVSVPLEGLKIGEQLRWLKQANGLSKNTNESLERFYTLLTRLKVLPHQGRPLAELPKPANLPQRGIYFFLEPGEYRAKSSTVPRVVRVGTHAVSEGSKSTLRNRLRQHLGVKAGGGNHRGSIFRKHVGTALLAKEALKLETWGVGSSAPREILAGEANHEKRVSDYIRKMPVLWIDVPDKPSKHSNRAFIERNAIALLSNKLAPIDPGSKKWLGRFSSRKEIRMSGLWNLNHVSEPFDPNFLEQMESYVQQTCMD